jgi:2-oxoisovalerate dehydrogenase E2 component (dihydrolipoyl transacylase)
MSEFVVRLPDVGEGVAEAELVSWQVAVGDVVTQDTVLAEVLTDKATVEIYAPVAGTITALHGTVGDVLAIGGDFVGIETVGSPTSLSAPDPSSTTASFTAELGGLGGQMPLVGRVDRPGRTLAAPAVRERARSLGIELAIVVGTGPDGRITHDDLDRQITSGSAAPDGATPKISARSVVSGTTQMPLLGVRRMIAARMSNSASRIPHITYVEEIDMTQLEQTRRSLATLHPTRTKPTLLPFVIRAVVLAVAEQPPLNSTFDDEAEVLTTHHSVHVGIATQTPNGLMVPVVRNAQALDLWQSIDELTRVTTAARDGRATRDELSGSTITITSLGALGGLVTTPIINHPEVAIIGINKLQVRPVWSDGAFIPRTMMNLSSSFDHRIVDGWDAATFIQRIKLLLEDPALLFIDPPG